MKLKLPVYVSVSQLSPLWEDIITNPEIQKKRVNVVSADVKLNTGFTTTAKPQVQRCQ